MSNRHLHWMEFKEMCILASRAGVTRVVISETTFHRLFGSEVRVSDHRKIAVCGIKIEVEP